MTRFEPPALEAVRIMRTTRARKRAERHAAMAKPLPGIQAAAAVALKLSRANTMALMTSSRFKYARPSAAEAELFKLDGCHVLVSHTNFTIVFKNGAKPFSFSQRTAPVYFTRL